MNIVLRFELHRPRLLNKLRFLDIGSNHDSFDVARERLIVRRLAEECYVPVNGLLLELLAQNPGIQLTFSVSGVMIEQLEAYAPEVLKTFRKLAQTGSVEFLSETHYHSLAFMLPGREFEDQVLKHVEKLQEHFGSRPSAFRNTGMPYNEEIAQRVSAMGYSGIIVDGNEPIPNGWSPNYVYEHSSHDYLRILINNARFTHAFHSQLMQNANDPVHGHRVPHVALFPDKAEVVTFSVDYGSLWGDTATSGGKFKTLADLVCFLSKSKMAEMATASATMISRKVHGDLSRPTIIAPAEEVEHVSEWLGNEMQQEAFDMLLSLQPYVNSSNDAGSLAKWRTLQATDYFSYMRTDISKSLRVGGRSGQYATPYAAFINFMNIASELLEYLRIVEFRDGTNISRLNKANYLESTTE